MKIALDGGSFNPPGIHHQNIVKRLIDIFDLVMVVPCGIRPDKNTTNYIEPIHRATMADLAFGSISSKVAVDLFDLQKSEFTKHYDLVKHYENMGEIWIVVGADIVQGGGNKNSQIHKKWFKGDQLWNEANFCIITRPGYSLELCDYPPNNLVIPIENDGSSSQLRQTLHDGDTNGVCSSVASYINRYGLYRGSPPSYESWIDFPSPSATIEADKNNSDALDMVDILSKYTKGTDQCILSVGGDGTMISTIHKHWRKREPFIGINMGTKGYLLNPMKDFEKAFPSLFKVYHLPLLYAEAQDLNGNWDSAFGFNDAWVERCNSTTWIEVSLDGEVIIPRAMCDGMLVCLPQGSTAYSKAMGGYILPITAVQRAMMLVGNNVFDPDNFKPIVRTIDSVFEFRALEPETRPMRAIVDRTNFGLVQALRVRASKIASVQIAFAEAHDIERKTLKLQLPK